MGNNSRLLRGQVWRWVDPIYGEKNVKRRMDVEVGEMTLRYNRYVIIMQDTDTIDMHSVLVIPCSSHKRYDTDVRIDLYHVFSVTSTYAQPRKIFPAHPKMLEKYICTLDEEVMKDLEVSIATLMLPAISSCVTNMVSSSTIDDKQFNIAEKVLNVYKTGMNIAKLPAIDCKNIVKNFISNYIEFDNTSVKEVPIADIRDAFDDYCEKYDINSNEIDMPMFVDILCHELSIDDCFYSDRYKYHHISISNIKLLSEKGDEDENAETNSMRKWDDKRKREFLMYLELNGTEKTAEAYGIKENTVTKYNSQFLKELAENDENSSETSSDVNVEGINLEDPLEYITKDELVSAISHVSNIICNDIKGRNMYKEYRRQFKGHHPMKEVTYYSMIERSIYYSFFGLFQITEVKSHNGAISTKMNKIYESNKRVRSVDAILAIIDKSEEINDKNGLDLMKLIRAEKNGEKFGISKDILNHVRNQLKSRLNIKPCAVSNLVKKIEDTYCEQ